MDPPKSLAVFNGFQEKLDELKLRKNPRPLFKELMAKTICKLWSKRAMTFFDHPRVESAMRAIAPQLTRNKPPPQASYRDIIKLAKELG